jgi:hypothetical protein
MLSNKLRSKVRLPIPVLVYILGAFYAPVALDCTELLAYIHLTLFSERCLVARKSLLHR